MIDFSAEIQLVNDAHGEGDKQLIKQFQDSRSILRTKIHCTIQTQDRGAASELIRDVVSCAVIVHPNPEQLEDPWRYECFQIFRGSLVGAYEQMGALAKQAGAPWILKVAQAEQDNEGAQDGAVWKWVDVTGKKALTGCVLFAVNPALVDYTSEMRFRLAVTGSGHFRSPKSDRAGTHRQAVIYQRETYVEHIAGLVHA